jgi:ATP-dependent Clp protease, protease subunit
LDEDFLLKNKVFLYGPIDDKKSNDIIKKLMFLEDRGGDISLYINTPGGSVTSGLEIFDTIRKLKNRVNIIVTGLAASMGAIILNAVKGGRYLYKNSKVLIHQPLLGGRLVAPSSDIHIQADEICRIRHRLNQILSDNTGRSLKEIEMDTDRDKIFCAEDAVKYGLADFIV